MPYQITPTNYRGQLMEPLEFSTLAEKQNFTDAIGRLRSFAANLKKGSVTRNSFNLAVAQCRAVGRQIDEARQMIGLETLTIRGEEVTLTLADDYVPPTKPSRKAPRKKTPTL